MSGDNHNQADPPDLDAIEARAAQADRFSAAITTLEHDVPALVAEVRRLRSFAQEVRGVRGVLAKDADPDPIGQWERGHAAACKVYLDELDGALGMLEP